MRFVTFLFLVVVKTHLVRLVHENPMSRPIEGRQRGQPKRREQNVKNFILKVHVRLKLGSKIAKRKSLSERKEAPAFICCASIGGAKR